MLNYYDCKYRMDEQKNISIKISETKRNELLSKKKIIYENNEKFFQKLNSCVLLDS